MNGKALVLLLIGSLAFNVGVGTTFGVRAYNQHCGRVCDRECRPGRRAFPKQLDLRPDQLPHFEAEGDRLHSELRELRQSLAMEGSVLSDLLVSVEPDREAISAQLDKLAELHRQKQQRIVDHFLRFGETLDDDQRVIFERTIRDVFARCGAGPDGCGRHDGRRGPRGHRRLHQPDERPGERGGKPHWNHED